MNELTPSAVAAQAAFLVHWRCPQGHSWQEQVQRRVKLDQWKQGDRAACRICTGHWLETTFACGHTVAVQRMRALAERLCPDCWAVEKERRAAAWEERKRQGRDRAAELKPQCQADARVYAERLWQERSYGRLPGFLHRRAKTELVSKLTFSLLGERAFGNKPAPLLVALLGQLDALVLVRDEALDRCVDEPLELFGSRFWAPALGTRPRPSARPEPDIVHSLAAAATAALRLETDSAVGLAFELELARAYDDPGAEAATRELTNVVTYALKQWAHERGWRSWRELQVPLADERSTGRLDLVVFRFRQPDIVIELDSANVPRSIAKLEVARERGALPVWLRFGRGRMVDIPGVHVVDMTGVTATA
jgi:hypothetical protein